MLQISPKQTPTIEGDIDYTLFHGEYVKQESYYPVNSIKTSNILVVQGGTFGGLYPDTTVDIYPAGNGEYHPSRKIASGKVTVSMLNYSVISIQGDLSGKTAGDLWVF